MAEGRSKDANVVTMKKTIKRKKIIKRKKPSRRNSLAFFSGDSPFKPIEMEFAKTYTRAAKSTERTNYVKLLRTKDGHISKVMLRISTMFPEGYKIKNRRKLKKFKVKIKPKSVMGDYIALHGLVPGNELPKRLRGKIPKNEVWIRRDCFVDKPVRQRRLLTHENHELGLMEKRGWNYKKAHARAELREKAWIIPFEYID